MGELLLMLRFRLLGALHDAFAWRRQGLVKSLAPVALDGAFAAGVFLVARMMTAYLINELDVGIVLCNRSLSVVFYLLFMTVNLGNVLVCVAALFRSSGVEFLMTMPVRYETIFLSKLVDVFLSSSGALFLFGAAFLAGVASFFGVTWSWYLVIFFGMYLPALLIAGLSGVFVFIGLLWLAIAAGVRQFIAAALLLYFLLLCSFFSVTNPVELVHAVMDTRESFGIYLGTVHVPLAPYLPSSWLAECFHGVVTGDSVRALSYMLLSFSALLAVGGLVVVEASVLYRDLWLAVVGLRPAGIITNRALRFPLFGFGRSYAAGAQHSVLLRREFWLFVREPGQWLHLLLLAVLAGLFLVSLLMLDFPTTRPLTQAAAFVMVFSFNGFLMATACVRFVFPAVGLEGISFWSVRTSPVSLRKVYWHRFFLLFSVVFVFSELLTALSVYLLRDDATLSAMACTAAGCVALTLTALNFGGGAYFATFKERNPVRIASSQGGSLTFLTSVLYLLSIMLLLLAPLYRYFNDAMLGRHAAAWFGMSFTLIFAISGTVTVLSTIVGLRSIGKEQ